tara:strand:- start:17806 stop:18729 length:924 start_codon:yes stop_codon:yes gene_type:complete
MSDTSSKRVLIFGGSGFVGMHLAEDLSERGYDVVIVSRSQPRQGPWSHAKWDGRSQGEWSKLVDGAHAVVNLAGRTVDCIKTPLHCDQVLRSRVESTRELGLAVQEAGSRPKVWVQMSTASIHGDSELDCDEDSAYGYGFAPTVAIAWEQAFEEGCPEDVRQVILRPGIVLGRDGEAFKKLSFISKLGLGGTVSTGTQGMSWIHIEDMVSMVRSAIEDDTMDGAYIASSPKPVSNKVFMRALRKAVKMPIGLPAAAWMIRFGAKFILKTDPDLVLYGRYCIPQRLLDHGFVFAHPDLDEALKELCAK